MAFNPTSTIHLCNVPFDSSYKHQVYFTSRTEQQNYFLDHTLYTFTHYYTVRKTLPNGAIESTVDIAENIDKLYKCNYMFYQNSNHGARWFYAFITKLIYVNEETTRLVFETDVYQTWMMDCTLKSSYVVREHSETDNIGDNIVAESFNFEDYTYQNLGKITDLTQWGYLIAASDKLLDAASRGYLYSGVYQGLYFYYASTASHVNSLLDTLEDTGQDCIVSITAIPRFCLKESSIGIDEDGEKGATAQSTGMVFQSTTPAALVHTVDMTAYATTFDGYVPINKKMYTSPFTKLIVTNGAGEEAEYTIEDFTDRDRIQFTVYGDVSPTPSVTLVPNNYKGLIKAREFSISLSGFPQCGFNSDTFKLWMNKNMTPLIINTVTSAIGAGTNAGVNSYNQNMAAQAGQQPGYINYRSPDALAAVSSKAALAGFALDVAGSIANSWATVYRASKEPNQAHLGQAKNNLLTAMGENTFRFMVRHVKRCYAETIDNYFTMFGYQTNKVKIPNLSSRPYFNYVQTIGVNIIGGIPNEDMDTLKAIFNAGVTIWKPNATIGDYSVDNTPS